MAAASNETMKFNIVKLNDDNYYLWKYNIEMALLKEGIWEVISEPTPEIETKEWKRKDGSARATIALSMEPAQTNFIRHCKSAIEMWTTIKTAKEISCMSSRRHLRKLLNNLEKDPRASMSEYISSMCELVDKLSAVGEETSENLMISILIGGLPEEYDGIINSLESNSDKESNLNYVKIRLLEEEERKRHRTKQSKENNIMYSQDNQRQCYNCKSIFHIKKNCPDLKRYESTNNKTYNRSGNISSRNHTPDQKDNQGMIAEEIRKMNINKSTKEDDFTESIEQSYAAFTAMENNTKTNNTEWIIDSGANSHMTFDSEAFHNYLPLKEERKISLADGSELKVEGEGTCIIKQTNNKFIQGIKLYNVLHVPGLAKNLISINKICDQGYEVDFIKNKCTIQKNNKTYIETDYNNGLFTIEALPIKENQEALLCIHKWHEKLGHRNIESIKQMAKTNQEYQIKIDPCSHDDNCNTCIQTNLNQTPFRIKEKHPTTQAFKKLTSDVCGPIGPKSLGGAQYFITIQDEFTKYTHTETMNHKNEATEKITNFMIRGHNIFGYFPNSIKTDNGGEFTNNTLYDFLLKHGIQHQRTIPYCPQQNGCAERKNRTLMSMVRSMLLGKQLPNSLWGEAVVAATHIYNRLAHTVTLKTPYEMWRGHIPNMSKLHTFGSQVYFFIPKELRSKLNYRAKKGILVGYCDDQDGYRIWDPKENRIHSSRTIKIINDELDEETKKTINGCTVPEQLELEFNIIDLPDDDNGACRQEPNLLRRSQRVNIGVPPKKLIQEV